MRERSEARFDVAPDPIDLLIVVPVLRRGDAHLPNCLVPDEIGIERGQQLFHRQFLLVEDESSNGRQRIDDGSETHHVEEPEIERAVDRPHCRVLSCR